MLGYANARAESPTQQPICDQPASPGFPGRVQTADVLDTGQYFGPDDVPVD